MRIQKFDFKVGASKDSPQLFVAPGRITVFVGPNNGGKSAALREIHTFMQSGREPGVIFSNIQNSFMDAEEVRQQIDAFVDPKVETGQSGVVTFGWRGNRNNVHLQNLLDRLNQDTVRYDSYVYQVFLKYLVLNLGGENRLTLANGGAAQNLAEKPHSTIATLFKDDELRHRVSDIIHEAFGFYLLIDPVQMGALNYTFSDKKLPEHLERSFCNEAIEFFSSCQRIESLSDGTRAYIGIITEVLAGIQDILLMDEPEAFLHPSLAYLLGREITRNISAKKQMFVATHSPSFLMGCISMGMPVDIVRLTHKSGEATARLLPAADLKKMMQDPLLKSVGVINALFHESAVVVEADGDRAFYEEINSRLNLYDHGGMRHTTFLNAHNKHEAVHIARVLRNAGIPAAIILDVDWIKEDGKVGARYLASAGVPDGLRPGLIETRRRIRGMLEALGGDYKTAGGVAPLKGAEAAAAHAFFAQMEQYGLFTVKNGELESWLPELGVNARKDLWLGQMFERLGSDPDDQNFVKPAAGDVWSLVRRVGQWVSNQQRDGMDYVDPAEF